jgi:hypothetical protein
MRAAAGRGSRSNSDNTESDQAESDSPSVAGSSASLEDHREKDSSSDRIFLPQEEYLRLRQEGRCFKCKVRGHLSRNCPGDQEEEPVEASAVHFFEEEEEYSNDYETESDEISAPEISHQTNIQDCSTDLGNFSSSEENSDDGYSDSSNEFYVGAIRIDFDRIEAIGWRAGESQLHGQ